MVKEIFFHYSEFKGDLEALQAGDDVEFTIKDRNVSITNFQCQACLAGLSDYVLCFLLVSIG